MIGYHPNEELRDEDVRRTLMALFQQAQELGLLRDVTSLQALLRDLEEGLLPVIRLLLWSFRS